MWNLLRRWLSDIPVRDPISRRHADLLQVLEIGILITISLAIMLNVFVFGPSALTVSGLAPNLLAMLGMAIALALLRRGRLGWSVAIVAGVTLIGEAQVLFTSGLRANGASLIVLLIPITLVGLLIGRRGMLLTIGASIAIVAGAAILQQDGALPGGLATPPNNATAGVVVQFILVAGLLGLILDRFGATLRDALNAALNREQELEHSGAAQEMHTADLERKIAEYTRIEAALRESEARYRLLAENSRDLIELLDHQGNVLYASPSHLQVLGYISDQLIHTNIFKVIHPDDTQPTRSSFRDLLASGTSARIALRLRNKTGEWVDVEAILSAINDDAHAVSGILLSAREITERRRVEAALRESEERYRLITENSSDLISLIELDSDPRQIYASPSYLMVLGYDPTELVDTGQLELIHPDDRSNTTDQFLRIATNGTAQATYRVRHADGSWRWIEVQATAITQQGRSYAVAVGRDITERKRLEDQFLQAQKMESVGRLAGGLAHDFNNLLTAIMGNLELALDALPSDHIARDDLGEIQKATDRAAGLTRQLLAFARRQAIEPRIINLNDLIRNMDKLLRRLIGEDIDLVTLPAPELGQVKADPGQIEQVIVNLAVNARDAMPDGGKLTIETRNVMLDQNYTQQHIGMAPGNYVLLAVSDTGTGIDEETLRRIFEPLFTTKEKGRGTGLGLSTCYGIIQQHGGNIWPYSEVGHGSTFRVYLPRVDAPVEAHPQQGDVSALPHGTETVLLAEDEAAVRTMAARVLRERGYTVLEAIDGDEGLRVAREYAGPIHLLLTDVVMPHMSGRTLVDQVSGIYPSTKVLFISGYADSAIIHQGQLDPGVEFLHKPFSPSALARKVREVLDS
jgi:two-component system cell cycle sensor histidine kinase/response regulator CckA